MIIQTTPLSPPVLPNQGGTGIVNNAASTLAISGNFDTTITVSASTALTLPTSGVVLSDKATSITSAQLLGALTNPTGTGVAVFGTSPTFTTQIIAPIVYGASGANGTLTIDSTSNATKGAITFGTVSSLNQHIFQVGSSSNQIILREKIGSTTQAALYIGVASGSESSTNYTINYNGTLNINTLSTTTPLSLMVGSAPAFTITPTLSTAVSYFSLATRARTSLTTTANVPILDISSNTQTWATGAVPLQYFYWFHTQTAAAAAASTFTYISSAIIEYTTRGNNSTFGTTSAIFIPTLAYTSTTTAIGIDIQIATGATNSYGLRINGGTTTSAPILLTSGTNMTTAVAGAFEYDATTLWFTNGGAQRQELMQSQQSRVTIQFDKVNTTLANITGLTATLVAAGVYIFEATLFVTKDAVGGEKYAMAGTCTATSIVYEVLAVDNGGNLNTIASRQTALGGSVGQASGTTGYTKITGIIVVNGAGTLVPQFAQQAANGTSSILVGSNFVVNLIV